MAGRVDKAKDRFREPGNDVIPSRRAAACRGIPRHARDRWARRSRFVASSVLPTLLALTIDQQHGPHRLGPVGRLTRGIPRHGLGAYAPRRLGMTPLRGVAIARPRRAGPTGVRLGAMHGGLAHRSSVERHARHGYPQQGVREIVDNAIVRIRTISNLRVRTHVLVAVVCHATATSRRKWGHGVDNPPATCRCRTG
jgi:hypothetical protein